MPDTQRKFDDSDLRGFDRLAGSLGFLLRLAQIAIYDRFFEELGSLNMKPGEFSVLWLIYNNPGIRQGRVAQRLSIKNARMTKLIRRAEDDGYVSRRVPDDDRRAVELTLTAKGRELVEEREAGFFSYFNSGETALTSSEMEQFVTLLKKFSGIGARDES